MVTAVVLGLVLQRRAIHYLPLVGMIVLAAGIAVFRVEVPPSQALTLVGSSLTGIGLGATVAPALFVAGFSLASANLQRVFAIVELLRAVAAFMVAPIFIYFAATISGSLDQGAGIMLLVGIGLAIAGAAFGVSIYALAVRDRRRPTLTVSYPERRQHGTPHPFWQGLARDRPTGPSNPKAFTDMGSAQSGMGSAQSGMGSAQSGPVEPIGPVLFAYDGSELAGTTIGQAARQLETGRDALVLWCGSR